MSLPFTGTINHRFLTIQKARFIKLDIHYAPQNCNSHYFLSQCVVAFKYFYHGFFI